MKLAAGSQTETQEQKMSSVGHEEQHMESDDYEEVAVCQSYICSNFV